MSQGARGIGSIGIDIARTAGNAAGLGVIVQLDVGVGAGRRTVVEETQVLPDRDGSAVGVTVTIRCGGGKGDQSIRGKRHELVGRGCTGVNHRTDLVERHGAVGIHGQREDLLSGGCIERVGTLTAYDHSAFEEEEDAVSGGRIDQAADSAARRDAKSVAFAAANRSRAIGTEVEGKDVAEFRAGVGCEGTLVDRQQRDRAGHGDVRAVVGETDVAAKVERHGLAGLVAIAIFDGGGAAQRDEARAEDLELGVIVAGRAGQIVIDLLVLRQRDDAGVFGNLDGKD